MGKRIQKMIAAALCLSCVILLVGCAGPLKKATAKTPYEVKMEKVFICGSREGDLLVINMEVKNTSKEYVDPSTVAYALTAKMGETSLKESYIDPKNPNAINLDATIESGKTGKSQAVFALGDKAEGEVSVLGLAYAEGGGKKVEFLKETVDLAKVERIASESDYALTIDNVVATDDGEGASLVVIDMTFTNNGDETTSFGSAIQLEIFQGGVALKSGYLPYNHPAVDEERESNTYLDIQKGATLNVREVFTLNDPSAPVQIKAVDTYSFDQAVLVEKEIQLK